MNETILENKFVNYSLILVGNFLLALAVCFFILPYNILSGGVAGIAVILNGLFKIDKTLVVNSLTIILFIIGYIFLGKSFAIKTFVSSIVYPIFISFLTRILPIYKIDPFLACIYGGILSGIGIGIVFRCGASTGGMDIPPLIINKIFNIKISTLFIIIDTLTVLFGFIVFGINEILMGFICVYLCGVAVEKTLTFGGSKSQSVQIISDKYIEIIDDIHNILARGTTLFHANGGYTNKQKPVILVVVTRDQYIKLVNIIDKHDKNAFVITSDVISVHGEGFSMNHKV